MQLISDITVRHGAKVLGISVSHAIGEDEQLYSMRPIQQSLYYARATAHEEYKKLLTRREKAKGVK